jgi:hypothetical protein
METDCKVWDLLEKNSFGLQIVSSAVHPVMLMLQYQIVQHHQVEAVALIGNCSFTGCGAQL